MMPQRIQRKRTKGWRMPEGAVFVGRPTKWGNPFKAHDYTGLCRKPAALDVGAAWEYEGRISADGATHHYFHPDGRVTHCTVHYMTPAQLAECYRLALTRKPSLSMQSAYPSGSFVEPTVQDVIAELAGRDLVCWCPLDQPCHADVLIEIANGEQP